MQPQNHIIDSHFIRFYFKKLKLKADHIGWSASERIRVLLFTMFEFTFLHEILNEKKTVVREIFLYIFMIEY